MESKVHYPEDEYAFKFKNYLCEDKGGLCGNSCDSRCTISFPKGDPEKARSEQAACRCDPEGLVWDGVDVGPMEGDCNGCDEPWEGTCQESWKWYDPETKSYTCTKVANSFID